LEVGAVPGGDRRGEEAGCGAKLGVGVESDAEAIGVVLASARVLGTTESANAEGTRPGQRESYESEARVKGLLENRVRRVENQLGEQDLVAALVNLR
jgi:hypothetical protein